MLLYVCIYDGYNIKYMLIRKWIYFLSGFIRIFYFLYVKLLQSITAK